MHKASILSAALLTIAGSAHADHRGWYLAGAVGVSDAGSTGAQFNAQLAADGHASNSQIDEKSVGFSARIGFRADQLIGFEVAATSYGEADIALQVDTSSDPDGAAQSIADNLPVLSDSISASMTFTGSPFESQELAPLSFSASLGVAAWRSETTVGSASQGFSVHVERESVDPVYSLSAQYKLSNRIAIGIEYSHLDQGASLSNELLATTFQYSL